MATLNINLKLGLDDANQISFSLQADWAWTMAILKLKQLTPDERRVAHTKTLVIERILRELDVDVVAMREDFKAKSSQPQE